MAKKARAAAPETDEKVAFGPMQSGASADEAIGVDGFAGMIKEAWQKSVGGIIEVGRLLVRAKAELPHGQFGLLFKEKKVPFSDRTGERLMEVAQHPVVSDPTHGSDLPPHWRTLHALTRLPAEKLKSLLAKGEINADTERREVEHFVKQDDPTRILDALGTLLEFQKDWPEPANLAAELKHRGNIDTNTLLAAAENIGAWLSLLGQAWTERTSRSSAITGEQSEEATDTPEQTEEIPEATA